tara:strand:+ start:9355 stop:9873 length:519 start_codon:yes stop_codon:yes gene_type:complete
MSIAVLKKKHFASKNISHNNNFSKFPGMSSKTFMNRKKYWSKRLPLPGESKVTDCDNLEHIYNNWVQEVGPLDSSSYLSDIAKANLQCNLCEPEEHIPVNNGSSKCCKVEKSTLKDTSPLDYTIGKRNKVLFNTSSGCNKPFPFRVNSGRTTIENYRLNITQAYLADSYYSS